MKLNIRQIEAFRAVVTMKSMSGAAALLGVSQPAISRLIGDLQKTLEMRLFTRARGGVVPTRDARQFFDHVEKLFVGFEDLGHQIQAIKDLREGELTIVATDSYVTGILPQLLRDFKTKHPNISVAFHLLPHEDVVSWLATGRADVGITSQFVARPEILVTRLASRPMIAIFPKGHRFETLDRLVPQAFEAEEFVSYPRGSIARFQIDHLFDGAGVTRKLSNEASSVHAICALVRTGMGVAVVNPFVCLDHLSQTLSSCPLRPSVMMDISALRHHEDMSLLGEAFYAFVVEHAPEKLRSVFERRR